MKIEIGTLPTVVVTVDEPVDVTEKLFNSYKRTMFSELVKDGRQLSICFVGNSYSRRMADQMCKILKGYGIRNAKVTSLYKGSCSIQTHAEEFYTTPLEQSTQNCTFIMSDGVITRYVHGVDAPYDILTTRTRAEFFENFGSDYDIISFHQMSGLCADYSSYQPYLSDLMSYIGPHVKDDVIYVGWAPWSYPSKENISGSPVDTFEESCELAVKNMDVSIRGMAASSYERILTCPMSIAVQNLKKSYYGEHFNDDYLHLTLLGDAFAAMMFLTATFELNPYDCDLGYLYDDGTHDPTGYFNPNQTVGGYPVKGYIERVFQGAIYDAMYRRFKLSESYFANDTSANCIKIPEGIVGKFYYNNHDQYNVSKDKWSSAVSTSSKYALFENGTLLNPDTVNGKSVTVPTDLYLELVEWNTNDVDKSSSTQWYIKVKRTRLLTGSVISLRDDTTNCCLQVHRVDNQDITSDMLGSIWSTVTGISLHS